MGCWVKSLEEEPVDISTLYQIRMIKINSKTIIGKFGTCDIVESSATPKMAHSEYRQTNPYP